VQTVETGAHVAAENGLELFLPVCDRSIGSLIRTPQSSDIIHGVKIEPFRIWPDDRGYFLEVLRVGHGLAAQYPPETTQVSSALSYPGTIKAFHFHMHQTDCWVPAIGMFQFVLVDLRRNSPTFGLRNTMYVGALSPWQVLIPPGIGHGYKVIGSDPGILIYVTDRHYNPQDEGRIPYNDGSINYDWELQHK
jgi:dTDP-4-dehydrorhamnose 3,5-epimerase